MSDTECTLDAITIFVWGYVDNSNTLFWNDASEIPELSKDDLLVSYKLRFLPPRNDFTPFLKEEIQTFLDESLTRVSHACLYCFKCDEASNPHQSTFVVEIVKRKSRT